MLNLMLLYIYLIFVLRSYCNAQLKIYIDNCAIEINNNNNNNFQIETHNFKFTKHVSDDRHPSSVVNTSEPLVGVI